MLSPYYILLLLHLLVSTLADDCIPWDPFGANCGESPPAIPTYGSQTVCSQVSNDCPGGFPTASDCVNKWCDLGCADANDCCSSTNKQSCFKKSSSTTTSSPYGSTTFATPTSEGSEYGSGDGVASSLPAGADQCTIPAKMYALSYLLDSTPKSP